MKTIKNYETHITAPKHVNIQKKNDNLIFKGPLGITLINLALHDKNGYSQLSLLLEKETSIIFFKSCNKAFFKSMLKIIKDKMHVVLNGFLVSLHVRGVGYRVEIQNNEFGPEKHNSKLFPLNNNLLFGTALNVKKQNVVHDLRSNELELKQNNKKHIFHKRKNLRLQHSRKNLDSGTSFTRIYLGGKQRAETYLSKNTVLCEAGFVMEAGWLHKQALLHVTQNAPVSLGSENNAFQRDKPSSLELTTNVQTLFFKVGFSHDFKYMCPSSVRVFTKQQTLICIYGIDRNQVSTIAAKIRMIKKPSVYKGKGIIFLNEKITLKQGKRK